MRNLSKLARKRTFFAALTLLPWFVGVSGATNAQAPGSELRRFDGISLELVVSAIDSAEMEEVVMTDDRGVQLFTRALVSRTNRSFMSVGGGRVPLTVHVVWREGTGWDKMRQIWNDGVVAGDYTIHVAERIPDAVLNEIRAHGGELRLKFRLKPDGVLFGWDIGRKGPFGDGSVFLMPGGDFLETRY